MQITKTMVTRECRGDSGQRVCNALNGNRVLLACLAVRVSVRSFGLLLLRRWWIRSERSLMLPRK